MGTSLHQLNHPGQARTHWDKALAILHDIGALTTEQAAAARTSTVPPPPRPVVQNL